MNEGFITYAFVSSIAQGNGIGFKRIGLGFILRFIVKRVIADIEYGNGGVPGDNMHAVSIKALMIN